MTPDVGELIRAALAHQAAMLEHRARAAEHMQERDQVIHQLRDSDPERWSYAQIAKATGLTPVNVVKILRKPSAT